MSDQLVADGDKAYSLAVQEDRIRKVLGETASGNESIINRLAQFLVAQDALQDEKVKKWRRINAFGNLVGDIAYIMVKEGSSDMLALYEIFSESDLFKSFYMPQKDINVAESLAFGKIGQESPEDYIFGGKVIKNILGYLTITEA